MMTAKIVRTKPNVASCVSGNTDRESPPSYFCSVVLLMEQASSAMFTDFHQGHLLPSKL